MKSNLQEKIQNTQNSVSILFAQRNFSIELVFHSLNVAILARDIGKKMRLSYNELNELFLMGLFHDIGKCNTPKSILLKPGELTPRERKIMNRHPIDSEKILLKTNRIYLDKHNVEKFGKVVRSHHEKYIGNGYPNGLKGENIPFMSRIITIADIYDAITSPRIYRKFSIENPLRIIKEESGVTIDPYIFKNYAQNVLKKYEHNR